MPAMMGATGVGARPGSSPSPIRRPASRLWFHQQTMPGSQAALSPCNGIPALTMAVLAPGSPTNPPLLVVRVHRPAIPVGMSPSPPMAISIGTSGPSTATPMAIGATHGRFVSTRNGQRPRSQAARQEYSWVGMRLLFGRALMGAQRQVICNTVIV